MTQSHGSKPPHHILFISHEASRSGAPLMLLHLLCWLRANRATTFEILSLVDGPLLQDFSSFGPAKALNRTWMRWFIIVDNMLGHAVRLSGNPLIRATARLTRAARRWAFQRQLGDLQRFSLIYANSAVSGHVLDLLPDRRPPLVTHVHELSHSLRYGIPRRSLEQMLKSTDRFIACSTAVRDVLASEHDVPHESITVCHEPIVAEDLAGARDRYDHHKVLHELGIPADSLVVGASGTREWRKGTDLFALVAASVLAKLPAPQVYFVWVGGVRPNSTDATFRYDVAKLGIENRVRFVETTADPHRYFSIFDVMVLTSREDPFPLVALEAAAMEIPVVGFDSGGLKEMLPEGCGIVVGYADTAAMTESVVQLLQDPVKRKEIGSSAAELVVERYDIDAIGPAICAVIDEVVGGPSR